MSCRNCAFSVGMDLKTAQELRRLGYKRGMALFYHDFGFVCERHAIVGPTPSPRCGFLDAGAEAAALPTTTS
jgi:hypothetical protein